VELDEVRDPDRLRALIEAMLLIESDLDLSVLLQSIVATATRLVGARYGALGITNDAGTGLTNFITYGMSEEQRRRIGDLPRGHGLLGEVLITAKPRRSDDLPHDPASHGFPTGHPVMTTFLGVPVMSRSGRNFGNLYLTDRVDGEPFSDEDEAVLDAFGHAAGLIVDEARLREQLRELTLTEERERLARDLHDTVIQRLFAVGLSLQATLATEVPTDAHSRISAAVDSLDETIREIRTTIFEMTLDRASSATGVRTRVLDIIEEVTTRLNLPVDVAFTGAVDNLVGPRLADHLVMVLRELLANAVRHSGADQVAVRIAASDGQLELVVEDNGVGVGPAPTVGRGLRNISDRAAEMAGECRVGDREGGGTTVTWVARRLD
jgi:signal transduction histidine kinase